MILITSPPRDGEGSRRGAIIVILAFIFRQFLISFLPFISLSFPLGNMCFLR